MLSNPLSQSKVPVALFIPLLAAIIAAVPLAIDMYLPAMKAISTEYDTPMTMVQMTLSTFLIGYAIGQLVFGPLADIIGRRPVVLAGLIGFTIFSVLLAFATNIEQFLVIRFLQAFIGAAAAVPIMGYVKVIYGDNVAKGMSYVSMIMMLAPMIAPALGIVFMELYGWRLIFMVLAVYGLVVLIISTFTLPKVERVPLQESLTSAFFKAYKVVFSERSVHRYLVMVCFGAVGFFAYLTAIPFVYMKVYGVSEELFGILFALNVGMFMFGSFINTRLIARFGSMRLARWSLILSLIGAAMLVVVNFLQLHLYWTVVSLGIFLSAFIVLTVNTDALILLAFPDQTGTATGVIGTVRFGCGAVAGPVLALFPGQSAMPFTYLIFISIMINGICLFWPNRASLQKTVKTSPSVD